MKESHIKPIAAGAMLSEGFWGYFIYTGSVSSIWPMFGTANQLLAGIALTIGTSYLINHGKLKYAWITIVPMIFILAITFSACTMNILNIYIHQIKNPGTAVHGAINLVLTVVMMVSVIIILRDAIPGWIRARRVSMSGKLKV